ncbi:F-box/kelch-repeat protein At1g80440-like [Curcuma longa]|uniref:F-box/kelch-repeat protein At1g80440-like n=1 Tax=Curcuma longa TaxID=136217 RepID=UPI003D9F17B4
MEAELIPGLPDDMALECLLRLPFHDFASARRVCKRWRREITSLSFYNLRKAGGHARPLVALAQFNFFPGPRRYHNLIIFDPTMGVWTRLPAVFNRSRDYRVAAVGHELVVLSGDEFVVTTVDVYNLLTGVGRRGATMPGPRRADFAFAATAEARMAYVAGGFSAEERLQSALAYDVAADAWVWLPDMARPRAVCRGIFVNGAFCVAGGQWSHDWTFETFNVAEGRWTTKQVKLLEEALIDSKIGVAAAEGRVYRCRWNGEVDVCSDAGGWQRLGVFSPDDLYWLFRRAPHLEAWNGGVMLFGITAQAGLAARILEEGKGRRVVVMPTELTTGDDVQFFCSFQL